NPMLDERFIFLKGALESTRAERQSGIAAELAADARVGPNDAAVVISNSGRNAAPVEMALEMKNRGVPVIAITSLEQSRGSSPRHESGKRLFEIADVAIDNCVPPGDALVGIDGSNSMTGASSTVAGSAIIHSIVISALCELAKRGVRPSVLPSANLEGTSSETLRDILRPYADRIKYLDIETELD
ncbi:MAG TPA: sugar isomerase domain-containing protein, partial [Pyrinomonadaceae bacterium]|nr:sugar isomerase domain-containing protein [Pyrinomonadaceae bacterium]